MQHSNSVSNLRSGSVSPTPQGHGTAIIAEKIRKERPARCSGLPWDVRPLEDPLAATSQLFGICTVSHEGLRRLDYALRVALLAVLPLSILTENDATSHIFTAPTICLIVGIVLPQPRVGATINAAQQALAAIGIQQALTYGLYALEPSQHVVFWFFLYILTTLVIAFLTEGLVTKLGLYFMNIMFVTEYHGTFPKANTKYVFAGDFALSVLIGVGVGLVAGILPYPRTNRHDAQRAMRALYSSISVCFGGVSHAVFVTSRYPAVQRRVFLRRIVAARAAIDTHHAELKEAAAMMRFEPHSAEVHDRIAGRLFIASEVASSLDGLIAMVQNLSRNPSIVDDSDLAQDWGRRMQPNLSVAADYVDEVCIKAGDLDYKFTRDDVGRIDRLRETMREAFDTARRFMVTSTRPSSGTATPRPRDGGEPFQHGPRSPIVGTPTLDVGSTTSNGHRLDFAAAQHASGPFSDFPFLAIGYFTACHGRLMRTLGAMPLDGAARSSDRSAPVEPITPEPKHGPGFGGGDDDEAAAPEVACTEAPERDDEPVEPFRLPRSRLRLPPTEAMPLRVALFWPRCIAESLGQFAKVARRDQATLLKMREAAKLCFAMTTALIAVLVFGDNLPASGAAVIAFVKDANAATTMVKSLDYIGATIAGSVYGFLAVSVATSLDQVIAMMCVIAAVTSYIRASPRYATPAFLVTFFAASTMAPGIRDEQRLLATVQTNVASMTWLVITHAFLWPVWPSQLVHEEVVGAIAALRSLISDVFVAVEATDPEETRAVAESVVERRVALRALIEDARQKISQAAREPTLRVRDFPEREHMRVVDALAAVSSMLFPVAGALRFLSELPPHPRRSNFVPTAVLGRLRRESRETAVHVDVLLRGIGSLWTTDADVSATILTAHAESVRALEACIAAAASTYMARLRESLDARPYEMPAINTIMHFYSALEEQLDYLLEASIDAHRAVVALH